MAMLSKAFKPENFESHKSLKLSFTNTGGLCSNFVDCESSLESNSPDNLALCETNLDNSIDAGNFFVRCYLSFIWKDSSTHMHGLAVYVKEGIPFALILSVKEGLIFRKLCRVLLVFDWLCFIQCLTFFFSIDHLFHLCTQFLILFHLT